MDDLQERSLPPVAVHIDTPSVARVYDYYLGGSTNWEVDRQFGDHVLERFPLVRRIVFGHRVFLSRVVRYLLEQGVRQFLDVGSGVPAVGATHQVAKEYFSRDAVADRAHRSEARVVYVDNDPIAVAHAELLLDQYGDPRCQMTVEADLREPGDLWQRALDTEIIDQNQPIALLLVGVLHLQQLDAVGNEISVDSVSKLCELLPPGSYVAISHITDEGVPAHVQQTLSGLKHLYDTAGSSKVTWRSRTEIESMTDNLSMVAPGWTSATKWHPEETGPTAPTVSFPPASDSVIWVGVGKKA